MTNCVNYDEAIQQYGYIVEQIARVLKPGRIAAVHCTDLKQGQIYQRDFPGSVVQTHEKYGLRFFCRITIHRDAWEFARRTRMKTLMHKTIVADSATSRIAPADYILVFLKPGINAVPITHTTGFRNYAGGRLIPARLRDYLSYKGDQKGNSLSHWIYRQYANPIWMDIRRGRLLPFNESKENPEERHVCPLQLDTIERLLVLWSNPGETILTPFAGVGSELWMSVRMGRKAIGAELKASYYRQALANMAMVDRPEDGDLKFGMGNGESEADEDDGEPDGQFQLGFQDGDEPSDVSEPIEKPELTDDEPPPITPDPIIEPPPVEPVIPAMYAPETTKPKSRKKAKKESITAMFAEFNDE